MKIFITGGAGYIGSHACVEILKKSHNVLVYDNLSNGSFEALQRVKLITNKDLDFIHGDIRNKDKLTEVMNSYKPDVVLHFAGLKAVGESVSEPLNYYDVNVSGTINLLNVMDAVNCRNIVFSSSATVYGEAQYLPYDTLHSLNPTNPYGRSKLIIEQILKDWCDTNISKKAVCLRYFNPIGAHESGLIGEDPQNTPNNLMPYISQVALGKRDKLYIYGDNYPTKDGTGERDYIHVVDLAIGHLKAIENINTLDEFEVLNLGAGRCTSVLQLVKEFENASLREIQTKIVTRRPGDIAISWADTSLAEKKLNIKFERTIKQMCEDSWRWQMKNPNGYCE